MRHILDLYARVYTDLLAVPVCKVRSCSWTEESAHALNFRPRIPEGLRPDSCSKAPCDMFVKVSSSCMSI